MGILNQLFQMGAQFAGQKGFDKLFEEFGQLTTGSDIPASVGGDKASKLYKGAGMAEAAGSGITPFDMIGANPGVSQGQPGFGADFMNILNDPITQIAMKNIGQPGQQGPNMSGMPQAQPGMLNRGVKTGIRAGVNMLPPPFNVIGNIFSSLLGG